MDEIRQNALWNCKNPHQGKYVKALCICSAGLLRSPTIAKVMSDYGYNTRAAGVNDYALIMVDKVLIEWADIIVCAHNEHFERIKDLIEGLNKKIYILNIPDKYEFRNPKLVEIVEEKLRINSLTDGCPDV